MLQKLGAVTTTVNRPTALSSTYIHFEPTNIRNIVATIMTTTTATTIKKPDTTFLALTKAVGIWTLIYIVLAHLLAIWKIQTPVVLTHHRTTNPTTTNPTTTTERQLFHRIHQLEMAIQWSQERNQILQEQILERQTFHLRVRNHQNHIQNQTVTDDASCENENDSVLQRLLSLYQSGNDDSSRVLSTTTLPVVVPPELHQWTTRQDWSRIQTLWDDMNHHHHHRSSSHVIVDAETECRPTAADATATSHQRATHEQLETRLRQWQTHEFLSPSSSTLPKLPLSWSSSRRAMQIFLQQTWNDAIRPQQLSGGSHDDDEDHEDHDPSCLPSHDWLEEFINVGWDVLHRDPSLDVRRDLLMAIHQRASSTSSSLDVSNVRLDIPTFVTTYHVHAAAAVHAATRPKFDNLRQYLDRPFVYELSIHLDVLLDYISGRHEILDDFMDQYIYHNPHFTSSSSLLLPPRSPSTTLMGPRMVAIFMNDVLGRLPMIPLSLLANSTWTRLVSAVRSTTGDATTPHIPSTTQ